MAAFGRSLGFGLCLLAAIVPAPESRAEVADAVMAIGQVLGDADSDTVPDLLDHQVRVRGTVIVPPGLLAQQYFQVIIQDATGGISLFSYDFSMPLERGDEVEAAGIVGQYRGAVQIQDVEVRKVGRSPLPEPLPVAIADAATWRHYGQRVRVSGRIGAVELSSFGTMPLSDDEGGMITVYFPQKVMRGFPFGLFPSGSEVEVVGVVSILDQSWPYDSGFQLVVTDPGQVQLISKPPPPWRSWAIWGSIGMLALIAVAAGVAFLVHRRQRDRERELATLNALSAALSTQGLRREQLAELAAGILTQHRLFDAVVLHGRSPEGLQLLAAAGISSELAARLDYRAPEIAQLDPERVSEQLDAPAIARDVADSGLHLLALVPLSAGTRNYGTLTIFSRSSAPPNRAQESTLIAATRLIAVGLESLATQQQVERDKEALQQLAITDDLTGLYNRRFLDEYLRIQMAMAKRRGHALAFLAADLDHFKRVNDTWGHAIGDRVLVGVADEIRALTRASDLPVRLGGEEFLIVLADSDEHDALSFAERLRTRFETTPFSDCVPDEEVRITVSIGVALYPQHGTRTDELLQACDAALYESKNQGRNRVTLAGRDDARRDSQSPAG